jgi:hypothetical protein
MRRSHSGILLFVQNSPILWLSRQQNTVETSTFGSEFVALRRKALIIAMQYKLQMFGMPLEGPAQAFCENKGVVKSTSILSPYYPRNIMRLTIMQYGRRRLLAFSKYIKKSHTRTLRTYLLRLYLRIGNVIYLVLYSTTCDAQGFRPFDSLGMSKTRGLKLQVDIDVTYLVKSELRGLLSDPPLHPFLR